MINTQAENYLTLSEVAAVLQAQISSEESLSWLATHGSQNPPLPFTFMENEMRFRQSDLDNFITTLLHSQSHATNQPESRPHPQPTVTERRHEKERRNWPDQRLRVDRRQRPVEGRRCRGDIDRRLRGAIDRRAKSG